MEIRSTDLTNKAEDNDNKLMEVFINQDKKTEVVAVNEETDGPTISLDTKDSSPSTEQNITNALKEESKGKKKRRKKSQMKKKNAQRKSSSSSSLGSATPIDANNEDGDTLSISNNTTSSNDDYPIVGKIEDSANIAKDADEGENSIMECQTSPITPTTRIPDLDIHFFSDTEATTAGSSNRGAGRPSTPIQSDSELEISKREKVSDADLMSNTASWKWGELPTPQSDEQKDAPSAQRNSMLSGMFNFMKKTNKMRQQGNDGGLYLSDLETEGMNPDVAALYFPSIKDSSMQANDDDRESGNGTSLPHSPSSMEGQKSLDSDYEDGKPNQDTK